MSRQSSHSSKLITCEYADEESSVADSNFEDVANIFEMTHAKIINNSVFVKVLPSEIMVMSEKQLLISYKHLTYEITNTEGVVKRKNFITDWLRNNPNQRCYEKMGMYPHDIICPSDTFNLWRPFDMDLIDEYTPKEENKQIILNHIKILCGNEDHIYEYFIRWIGQMLKYPSGKSICPTLVSEQGAGKGTFLDLLSKMMGSGKRFQTTQPSRDVWGSYNRKMTDTFLVNLNELKKRKLQEVTEYLKD